jgi:replicative DNA helicase
MTVIGGRPGSGKTTFGASAAWGYAATGEPVDYYHGEMSADQMDMRHVSDLSHALRIPIEHKLIREGRLGETELRRLADIEKVAALLPLSFHATGPCHIKRVISSMTRSASQWKKRGKTLRAVFIDYLQLYTADDSRGRALQPGTTECVSAVSKALIAAAHRLDLALFALSALGRQVEDRKDKRPQMNDLKQSGDLEQDADNVLLLFREEVYLLKEKPRADPQSKEYLAWEIDYNAARGTMEIIGDKTRHGKSRTRKVKFYGPYFAVRSGGYDEMTDSLLAAGLFDPEEEDAPFM